MKTVQLVQVVLVILALNSCATEERSPFPEDPNFIILFTDDQRYDVLGFAGNPHISTPNLDSICREGYYFNQACVTTSICSPSRAAVLTGRYGSANGVVSVGRNVGLNQGEKTLFQYLEDQHYLTGVVGKWHLENKPDECGFGFASFFEGNGPYYGREFMTEGSLDTATRFIEDYNVDQSITFMRSAIHEGKPFALFHCAQIPHMDHTFDWDVKDRTQEVYARKSLDPPISWKDDLKGKPEYLEGSRSRQRALYYGYRDRDSLVNHLERYYASITELDASLGRLFSFLRENDLNNNTYIIFMSDNGWFLGDHNFTSKVLAYEESIRVPFAINGPGISPRMSDALVLNIDIAPTVLELAGMDVPDNMQGVSLVPHLKGEVKQVREEIFYEAPESNLGSYPLYAIRTKEWKYIQTYDNQDQSKLIFEEIYHLTDDPYEMDNLAGDEKGGEMMEFFSGKVDMYREMAELLERIEFADNAGLDVFGIGEHYRKEFLDSAAAVILAAAARTKNIRLTSAVTVLSAADPVRAFQSFSTIDLISGGRAEMVVGRGSFTESFPLFGLDLNDYDELFAEKLDLLLKIRDNEVVNWSGKFRAALRDQAIYPRPLQNPLPVWIGVGGTPASFVRAGKLGLPLMVAVIGGETHRFRRLVDLYRKAGEEAGHSPEKLKVGLHSLGYVAKNSEEAIEDYYPGYAETFTRIGIERGWPPVNRARFDAQVGPTGALVIGSPDEVAGKILRHSESLGGISRFTFQMDNAGLTHGQLMQAIEMIGKEVSPIVNA